MTVRELVEQLDLAVVAGEERLDREVAGGYVGDLLSWVMARAVAGDVWVTVQGHPNVVAVAVLVGISAVVVSEGARIEPATVAKAEQEGLPLLSTDRRSFDIVARLAALGLNQ